jgi:hypothetical protein
VLAVLVLDETLVAGVTLPELVAKARILCGGVTSSPGFDERLLLSGYIDAHAHRYASTRFDLRFMRFFDVRDGFPRLLERDIPNGLTEVKYKVMLSAIAHFRITDTDFSRVLGTLP